MSYALRVINSLSSDDMVDVRLECGKARAYLAAWAVRLTTGKGVALLEAREIYGKPALWPVLILEA